MTLAYVSSCAAQHIRSQQRLEMRLTSPVGLRYHVLMIYILIRATRLQERSEWMSDWNTGQIIYIFSKLVAFDCSVAGQRANMQDCPAQSRTHSHTSIKKLKVLDVFSKTYRRFGQSHPHALSYDWQRSSCARGYLLGNNGLVSHLTCSFRQASYLIFSQHNENKSN